MALVWYKILLYDNKRRLSPAEWWRVSPPRRDALSFVTRREARPRATTLRALRRGMPYKGLFSAQNSSLPLSAVRASHYQILLVCKCVDVKPLGASLLLLIWITTIFFLICFTKYITNCRWLVQLSDSSQTRLFLLIAAISAVVYKGLHCTLIGICRRSQDEPADVAWRTPLDVQPAIRAFRGSQAVWPQYSSYHRKNITLRGYMLIVTSLSEDARIRRAHRVSFVLDSLPGRPPRTSSPTYG